MLVAYFYHQAQQQVADQPELGPIQDADFSLCWPHSPVARDGDCDAGGFL